MGRKAKDHSKKKKGSRKGGDAKSNQDGTVDNSSQQNVAASGVASDDRPCEINLEESDEDHQDNEEEKLSQACGGQSSYALSETFISKFSTQIGKEWHSLGIHLGYSHAQLEHLQAAFPNNITRCTTEMVCSCQRVATKYKMHMSLYLLNALADAQRLDLVEDIREKMNVTGEESNDPVDISRFQEELRNIKFGEVSEESKKRPYVVQNIHSQHVQIGNENVLIDTSHQCTYADKVRGASADDKVDHSQLNFPNKKPNMENTVMQKINARNVTINMSPPENILDTALPLQKRSADFESLRDALKIFETSQYILVVDKIPFKEDLGVLANLPLIAVFDFDQYSRKDGLFCYMYDSLEKERSVHIKTWCDKCSFTLESTNWIFMRGCIEHPDSLTKPDYDSWKDQIKNKLRATTSQLDSCTSETWTVVVVWPEESNITDHISFVLGKLSHAIDPSLIIVAKCKKKLPLFQGFDNITIVELDIHDVCSAIKSLSSPSKDTFSTNYKLPTNEGTISCLTVEEANWLKEDLEILYSENQTGKTYTTEDLRKEEDNFFKGGTLPWACLYEFGSGYLDATREIMEDMIHWIEKHILICKSGCISLYHDPGAGGTTLAQRILWTFRCKTPCTQIKQRSETPLSDMTEKLELLSSKTHLPILLLVDGEDEQRVESLQQKLQCCCIILYVKRCINPSPSPKTGRFALGKNLSSEEVKKVSMKYVDQCHRHKKSKKQIDKVEKFAAEVSENKAKHYLFEFGLAVHTYEYRGILSYVKEFLKLEKNEPGSLLPWQKALLYLALVYFYGQSSIPNYFLANMLGLERTSTLRVVEDFPKEMQELIVSETHVGRALHTRISHYYIAKEILEQYLVFPKPLHAHGFLPQLSNEAKTKLHTLAIDFIREAEEVSCGKENAVHNLLICTLISRENKAAGEKETQANKSKRPSKLSPILEDVSSRPPYSERFWVLEQLTKSFPSEPQFLAHLGRLYTICRPNEIQRAEEHFRNAELMCNRKIAGLRDDDIPYHVKQALMHIYHMFGNMFVSKVAPHTGRYLGDVPMISPGKNPMSETANQILDDVQSACQYFSKCREMSTPGNLGSFGFIGEINIRLMFCDFVNTNCGANDIHQFISANNTDVADFVRDSYTELHDLFLECFTIIEPERLDRSISNCQEWFAAIFGDLNPGHVIQSTEESVFSRRMNVALVKMKYSKEKSVGVLEYINDVNDIVYIVRQYEKNFQELERSTELPCAKRIIDLDFREWLCAIRHKLFPGKYTLEQVYRLVELWNEKLHTPFARFYLFVFTSLIGFGTSSGNTNRNFLIESCHLKIEMLKYTKQMTKPRYPREWLGPPSTYIERLIAGKRFFRDIDGNTSSDTNYQILIGTIRSPNDKPTVGYIDLDLGSKNTIAVEVFYVPAVANLRGRHYSGKRVEFELGFSMSHGYEAFSVQLLKSEKCSKCGKRVEVRSCDRKGGVVVECDRCSCKIKTG